MVQGARFKVYGFKVLPGVWICHWALRNMHFYVGDLDEKTSTTDRGSFIKTSCVFLDFPSFFEGDPPSVLVKNFSFSSYRHKFPFIKTTFFFRKVGTYTDHFLEDSITLTSILSARSHSIFIKYIYSCPTWQRFVQLHMPPQLCQCYVAKDLQMSVWLAQGRKGPKKEMKAQRAFISKLKAQMTNKLPTLQLMMPRILIVF